MKFGTVNYVKRQVFKGYEPIMTKKTVPIRDNIMVATEHVKTIGGIFLSDDVK